MLNKLVVALRAISTGFATASLDRRLTLLSRSQRDTKQEQQARGLEAQLFFDPQLLDHARARLNLPYKRQLLACGAGLMLAAAPYVSHAQTSASDQQPASETFSSASDEAGIMERIERWVEALLKGGEEHEGDPDDGKG